MSTAKERERALARQAQLEREAEIRRQVRARRRNQLAILLLFGIVALVIIAVLWHQNRTAETPGEPVVVVTPTPSDSPTTPDPLPSTPQPEFAQAPITTWGESLLPPSPELAEAREWTATIETNLGPLTVTIDGVNAPIATAAFVSLANEGYFDGTECHRLVTAGIYVLQCGDPTATGTGGPAFRYGPVENAPVDNIYPAGSFAMARQGNKPFSMGSQFFIVYADSPIPADSAGGYTVFGTVTEGLGIVEEVATQGTTNQRTDGAPAQPVLLTKVNAK